MMQETAKELSEILDEYSIIKIHDELNIEDKLFLLKEQYFVPECGEHCPVFKKHLLKSKRNIGLLNQDTTSPSPAVVNSVFGYAKGTYPCDKPYSCPRFTNFEKETYT